MPPKQRIRKAKIQSNAVNRLRKDINKLRIKPRPQRSPRKAANGLGMSRRPRNGIPILNKCTMHAVERITQITVAPGVVPGTLLYTLPVNPNSAPRLAATATQFDSWYGNASMEVETTGNSFSKDYVILRHVANGDPARLPTNLGNLLNLAETADRPGESIKLQLDSNKIATITAPWKESYNPRKPIVDPDLSECNNGLFILVADGSPGTESVNLTIRFKYTIHFYSPIVQPIVSNSSQLFTGVAPLSGINFLGVSPTSLGFGSATASGNIVNLPQAGSYILTSYATGTGLTAPTGVISSGGVIITPTFTNVASGTVSMGTWNVTVSSACTFTITQGATTVVSSLFQINPLKFT